MIYSYFLLKSYLNDNYLILFWISNPQQMCIFLKLPFPFQGLSRAIYLLNTSQYYEITLFDPYLYQFIFDALEEVIFRGFNDQEKHYCIWKSLFINCQIAFFDTKVFSLIPLWQKRVFRNIKRVEIVLQSRHVVGLFFIVFYEKVFYFFRFFLLANLLIE